MRSLVLAPLGLLFLFLLAGCGGGNSALNSVSNANGQGRATLTVKWPVQTRLIPNASNSIGVAITRGTVVLAHQILARPANGTSSTVTFPSLPTGNLTATATAFPGLDATGTPQATATVPLTITAGQTTNFSITMASTIDHFDLAALSGSVGVGETLQVAATAKDAAGATVLVTPGKLNWGSSAPGIATVDANGLVTGVRLGSTTITMTDSETGKTAQLTLNVRVFGPIAFRAPNIYSVASPNELVTADFDGDGRVDIVVGTATALMILYGNGDGTFGTPQTILTWTGGISPYSAADMNGDGKPDLVCTVSTQVLVINNLGSRSFAAPLAIPCGSALGPLATADFNGDGRQDIAVVVDDTPSSTNTKVFIFLNQGGGVYAQGTTLNNIWIIGGMKAADLNGDGKVDLLCSITTSLVGQSGTNIYRGDGTGNFTNVGGAGTASFSVIQTAIGDFNGDGKLDYAAANYHDTSISVILSASNGTFGTPASYGGLLNPDHMAAADMDGDGHPDIIVQNRQANYFTVLRDQNGLFPSQLQVPSGVPCGPLTVADLNGDGKPDVVISNYNANANGIAVVLNTTP